MTKGRGRLSQPQAKLLRALDHRSLKRFRRGFAETKSGPFFSSRTMNSLVRRELVHLQHGGKIAKLTEAGSSQLKLHDEDV